MINEWLARFVCGGIFLLILFSSRGVLAADKPIGTVFYSPAERSALVAARKGVDENAKGAESSRYTVSGIVIRGGGKSVTWLNGKPVVETPRDKSLPPIRVSPDRIVIDNKSVKVGETLDIISGERVSPLPAEAVKIKP